MNKPDIVTAFGEDRVRATFHIVHAFSDFKPAPAGGDPRKQIFAWLEGKQ